MWRHCFRVFLRVCLLFLISFYPVLSHASSEDPSAYDAYLRGDYYKASELWEKRALAGDAVAQYNLATLLYNGQGGSQSYSEAFKWYRVSALSGNTLAMFKLGLMYLEGKGIDHDCAHSLEWLSRSADAGYEEAMFELGKMAYHGNCSEIDYAQAFKMFQLYYDTIRQSDFEFTESLGVGEERLPARVALVREYMRDTLYQLGYIYFRGEGVASDVAKAVGYWQKASDEKSAEAFFALGLVYHNGVIGEKNISSAYEHYYWSVLEGGGEALSLLREKVIEGVVHAQYRLGLIYLIAERDERTKELIESREYQNKVFEEFLMSDSQYEVKTNLQKAFVLFKRAAAQGFAEAQYELGVLLTSGKAYSQNDEEAVLWYQMAANQKLAKSQFALGIMYKEGKGLKRDYVMARTWMDHAARSGFGNADVELYWLERQMSNDEINLSKKLVKGWVPHQGYEKGGGGLERIRSIRHSEE